jgi:ABC-type multidrug transport system fused ATPase/permease subunit
MAFLSLLSLVQSLVVWLGLAAGLVVCVWGSSRGRVSVGDTVLFISMMQQLYVPLTFFGSYYRQARAWLCVCGCVVVWLCGCVCGCVAVWLCVWLCGCVAVGCCLQRFASMAPAPPCVAQRAGAAPCGAGHRRSAAPTAPHPTHTAHNTHNTHNTHTHTHTHNTH